MGPHEFGPRCEPRPCALAATRSGAGRDGRGDGLLRLASCRCGEHRRFRDGGGTTLVAIYTANSPEPQLQSQCLGLQPGSGSDLVPVPRQSRARPRRAQLPRPQGVLARADSALGHDRLVAGTADGALLLLTEPEALGTLERFRAGWFHDRHLECPDLIPLPVEGAGESTAGSDGFSS